VRKRVAAIAAVLAVVVLAVWLWHEGPFRVAGRDGSETRDDGVSPPAPATPGLAPGAAARGERAAGPEPGDDVPADRPDAAADEDFFPDSAPRSLEVVTVDATTGARVAARWNARLPPVAAPFPAGAAPSEEAAAAQRRGMEESLARWEASFLPSGAITPEAVFHDAATSSLVVRPPSGYIVLSESTAFAAPIAVAARHVVAVVPVHREVVLDLRVLGPDGRPAEGAEVAAIEVAGRDVRPIVEGAGPGALRVRGIPHVAGEPVRIALEWRPEDWVEPEDPELAEGIASPQVVAAVPTEPSAKWNVTVDLPGPVGCLEDRLETDQDMTASVLRLRTPKGTPRGRVRVKALDVQGQPLRRFFIAEESLGLDGQALESQETGEILIELPVGEATVRLGSLGRFDAIGRVVVVADATTDLVVQEPRGARLDVLVVDEEGRPRPFARLDLGRAWFDVEGDRQRVDAFTDANGRRTISRVEPGTATVQATWGSRRGEAAVVLRDAERASVRIVAR
jgi:hypothetical protein